jgi:hypothetical protein
MRRTKDWWAALTRPERIWLVYAEKNDRAFYSPYLPDDCSECGVCGQPQLGGGGMCTYCLNKHKEITDLADYYVEHKGECFTCDGRGRVIRSFMWTAEKSIEEIGVDDWAGELEEWAEPCRTCRLDEFIEHLVKEIADLNARLKREDKHLWRVSKLYQDEREKVRKLAAEFRQYILEESDAEEWLNAVLSGEKSNG